MEPKTSSLRTPKATQMRVIAASLAGKSNRQIRRDTGLGRNTIARILSQGEVQAILACYRDEVRDLVPSALAVCARNLRRRNASWRLAIAILKGTEVLFTRQTQAAHEEVDEFAHMTDEQLREYLRTGEIPATEPGDSCQRVA